MKKQIFMKALITAAALGVAVLSVHAAAPKGRFQEADKNSDGVITYAEMMDKIGERFAAFDKNRDGYIAFTELPQQMPLAEKHHKRLEKKKAALESHLEKRGVGNAQEIATNAFKRKQTRMSFMAKHDSNGDERLTLEEFGIKAIRMFKRADLNGNGSITEQELEQAKAQFVKKRFRKMKRQHHG